MHRRESFVGGLPPPGPNCLEETPVIPPLLLRWCLPMKTQYAVHVFEARTEPRPTDAGDPTRIVREVLVSVTTDDSARVAELAYAAAAEAWPTVHPGRVPEHFGTLILERRAA
jgi:hypothetical protein